MIFFQLCCSTSARVPSKGGGRFPLRLASAMMHLAMMLLIKRFVLVRLFFTICSVLLNFQSKKISRDVDMLDA